MPLLLQIVGSVSLLAWMLLAIKQMIEAWFSEHNYEVHEDDEYDNSRWQAFVPKRSSRFDDREVAELLRAHDGEGLLGRHDADKLTEHLPSCELFERHCSTHVAFPRTLIHNNQSETQI